MPLGCGFQGTAVIFFRRNMLGLKFQNSGYRALAPTLENFLAVENLSNLVQFAVQGIRRLVWVCIANFPR